MRDIRVAAAQFEHRDNNKSYNLGRIAALTQRAADQDAEIVSFHECSITGYTFLQGLSREELIDLAEPVPGGPSMAVLIDIAREHRVVVMAEGRIMMEGVPRQVFAQVETLKKLGLDVPQITDLAYQLHAAGLQVPVNILTLEEMVSALCPSG